jgi:DNA polymerase-4
VDEITGPEAGWERVVLHVDMDAFFAAVEVLDQPDLAGRPVIVGGSGARGVVASCTYEARAFGVRSAMPSVRARRLCPDAVFVDGHYARYSEVSRELHRLFAEVTPLVEPIGLDEAFLDVTGARRLLGSAETIARGIRDRVRTVLALDCSVGVGRSKMVAKLASRAAKPVATRQGVRPGPGVVVVAPEAETAFLHPLPVRALWGVGPATGDRLAGLGIATVGDLAALPEDIVVRHFGQAQGTHLAQLARGVDPGPVVADRAAKSLGHEETFRSDIADLAELGRHVVRMSESVARQLRDAGLAGRTVTVKVKFSDFTLITRSHTLGFLVDTAPALATVATALLEAVELRAGVRLLGVSVSGFEDLPSTEQLAFSLAGPEPEDVPEGPAGDDGAERLAPAARAARLQANWRELTAAVDAIRSRYGKTAVGPAALVGEHGVEVPGRRDAPWGPSAEAPP